MDFHQLKIFSAVYRLRSFTGASKELNISQPTISEHIKNLEAELACRLFDRLGRSIMPTPQGDLLFPRAQQLLDSFSSLQEDLITSSARMTGKITFGASTIPGTYLIPAIVSSFIKKYPDITFEVITEDTGKIIEMIIAHEIFCGIIGARNNIDKLEYQPFIRDELLLVGEKGFCPDQEISPQQVLELPFLQREKGSGTRKCMEGHFNKAGIKPLDLNVIAILGSTAAVKEAAKQGLGVTVLSRLAVEEELANGSLQQIKIQGVQSMTRDFYLVHLKQRTMPAHYQAFCDHIREFPTD